MIVARIEVEESLVRDGNATVSIIVERFEGSSFIADPKAQAFAMLKALEEHMRGVGGMGQERFITPIANVERLINRLEWRHP